MDGVIQKHSFSLKNFCTDPVHNSIRFTYEIFKYIFLELSMEERERAHATQLQRAERESTSLRGEIKQIRSRMEAAIHQAAESDQLRAQIRERYFFKRFIKTITSI